MPEVVRFSPQRLLPPDQWRKRQIDTLKAVGEANYKQRVPIAKKDPIEAGIAAEDRYANEVKKAIDEKRRVTGLQATSADRWLAYALDIGAGRLVEGVTKREAEVKRFVDNWHPLLSDLIAKVDPMSIATLRERIDKAVATIEGLAALHGAVKKKLAGGITS